VQLREETKNIVGDVVLSSGIIAYLGAFPINYREEAIAKWKALLQNNHILVSDGYSLQNVMTDLITIGHWVNQDKLPNDNFSIDNSIILKNSRRWPLMIDPQLQANIWVRQTEKNNKLVIVRPNEN
jgi:dynein heavy chain